VVPRVTCGVSNRQHSGSWQRDGIFSFDRHVGLLSRYFVRLAWDVTLRIPIWTYLLS